MCASLFDDSIICFKDSEVGFTLLLSTVESIATAAEWHQFQRAIVAHCSVAVFVAMAAKEVKRCKLESYFEWNEIDGNVAMAQTLNLSSFVCRGTNSKEKNGKNLQIRAFLPHFFALSRVSFRKTKT